MAKISKNSCLIVIGSDSNYNLETFKQRKKFSSPSFKDAYYKVFDLLEMLDGLADTLYRHDSAKFRLEKYFSIESDIFFVEIFPLQEFK